MSDDIAISVQNVSKAYRIWRDPSARLKAPLWDVIGGIIPATLQPEFVRDRLNHKATSKYYSDFYALRDVSIEVRKGETVAIVGRNGSGKSTLLQIIAGTLSPTEGAVKIYGRVAAMLELGSSFNPDFTGRENVYLTAALLGKSRSEIDERFDEIAAFADIGSFIEQPTKTYSSGMTMRLAFAVNALSHPEIIIVDEALAVGDMNFQAKCMTALKRSQDRGCTILFVSHDIGSVKSLCKRAIYLEKGRLFSHGAASEIADLYVRRMREESNPDMGLLVTSQAHAPLTTKTLSSTVITPGVIHFKESPAFAQKYRTTRYGSAKATFTEVELLDLDDKPIQAVAFDQEVKIRLHCIGHADLIVAPVYYICDEKKISVLGAYPSLAGQDLLEMHAGKRTTVTYTTRLPLQEGNYSICAQLTSPAVRDETAEFLDVIDDAVVFHVTRRPEWRIWSKVYISNQLNVVTSHAPLN
ncbi:MAG: ABC transporter ATP-binding protein [Verrucomicrobia bacterium]|nr:ABC transporter ATP-binding protein [Verrucomicrobiota bacterium]